MKIEYTIIIDTKADYQVETRLNNEDCMQSSFSFSSLNEMVKPLIRELEVELEINFNERTGEFDNLTDYEVEIIKSNLNNLKTIRI